MLVEFYAPLEPNEIAPGPRRGGGVLERAPYGTLQKCRGLPSAVFPFKCLNQKQQGFTVLSSSQSDIFKSSIRGEAMRLGAAILKKMDSSQEYRGVRIFVVSP